MIIRTSPYDCCGCSACEQRCPVRCISMVRDDRGFLYPEVDESSCIGCNRCNEVCPMEAAGSATGPLVVLAAKNPDDGVRRKSSSGGIFTMLAEAVVKMGGVVFGAGFDSSWNVVHSWTESLSGLEQFRGSKYVQSELGDSFTRVQSFLKDGRIVLFSGTPCQIAGLKSFLGEDSPLLYTVSVFCHGVPSPLVWREYIGSLPSAAEAVCFRDKRKGWRNYGLAVSMKDGREVYGSLHENPFLKAFNNNFDLRPSCFRCRLKPGDADISIGDYWGVWDVHPEFCDDAGVSAVILNSEKGRYLFGKTAPVCRETSLAAVRAANPAYDGSPEESVYASRFWKRFPEIGTKAAVETERYMRRPDLSRFCRKVIRKLKRRDK